MRAVRASLLARAGSAIAVAALATGGVAAAAGAASAAAGHGHAKLPTTLHISNKVVAHHHHADALTGVLRSHRKAVAAETITLQDRAGAHRKWVVVGTGTTGADGSVTFTIASPTKKTQFEMVFAGDSTYRKSHSNVISLKK
jgi:hypothetical protein